MDRGECIGLMFFPAFITPGGYFVTGIGCMDGVMRNVTGQPDFWK